MRSKFQTRVKRLSSDFEKTRKKEMRKFDRLEALNRSLLSAGEPKTTKDAWALWSQLVKISDDLSSDYYDYNLEECMGWIEQFLDEKAKEGSR